MSIRVLVVDDSVFFRTKLQLGLSEDREIKVIAVASGPDDAIRKIEDLRPDVITLDVEMPEMNGIDFIKKILPSYPLPIVVVSSTPMSSLDALMAGAVDFVKKPETKEEASGAFMERLRTIVKGAATAKVRVRTAPSAKAEGDKPPEKELPSLASIIASSVKLREGDDTVIAIGASTGGTEAIISVVRNLPPTTPGIVIVQHMPANFTTLYAERLNKICKMSAKEAADGDRIVTGRIIVAAGNFHLTVDKDSSGFFIHSKEGERVSGHCPSVDVLFNSVANKAGKNAIGVILTGMGADGAAGITKMRQQGAFTIGQDKESCVVYGMPMEAYNMGGIVRQLPLENIGSEILYQLQKKSASK